MRARTALHRCFRRLAAHGLAAGDRNALKLSCEAGRTCDEVRLVIVRRVDRLMRGDAMPFAWGTTMNVCLTLAIFDVI
jgi:hypothetical protein